jgi:arylsulfatase A-like enzyme
VSLHDLAATFLDYAEAEILPDMDAITLRPILSGKRLHHRNYVTSGLNDWQLVWGGRYKLVIERNQPTHLFDLEKDPQEDHNLVAQNLHIETQLHQRLIGSSR